MSGRGHASAVSRIGGLALLSHPDVLKVDTYKDCDNVFKRWSELCPYYVWHALAIPVPGMPGLGANSVESIWQGTKLLDGKLDLEQMQDRPVKRPAESLRNAGFKYSESRFAFGKVELDIVSARWLIYVPAYLYTLTQLVSRAIHHEIGAWLDAGKDVVFYDWDSNMDIGNPHYSFSHSSILAQWYGRQVDDLIAGFETCASAYDVPQKIVTPVIRRAVMCRSM